MGGIGSGRPPGFGKDTVEGVRSLNVNRLKRAGYIGTNKIGGWEWTRDGERVAWICLTADGDRLRLDYKSRAPGEDWASVEETVEIAQVPCHLGGQRPYFLCPGVVDGRACRRRIVTLFGNGRYFLCRHCYRLAYGSQREGPEDRAMRRANKLRLRLDGEPGLEMPLPRRPKGMWRRTYERRIAEIVAADTEAEAAFMRQTKIFFERIGSPFADEWRKL